MKRETVLEREREREVLLREGEESIVEVALWKGKENEREGNDVVLLRCGWISRVFLRVSVLSSPRMVRESDFFNKWSLVLLLEFKGRTNIFTTQQKFTNFIYIYIYI